MVAIMERYSNNLEELVDERTEELRKEKAKTEQLLHRMLPPWVSKWLLLCAQLISNTVQPLIFFFFFLNEQNKLIGRGRSTYGPNRHRPPPFVRQILQIQPILGYFWAILGLYQPTGPPPLLDLGPPCYISWIRPW